MDLCKFLLLTGGYVRQLWIWCGVLEKGGISGLTMGNIEWYNLQISKRKPMNISSYAIFRDRNGGNFLWKISEISVRIFK